MPKPGMITASMFNSCMTKSFGVTIQKQCCRIACERLGVQWLEEQFDIGGVYAIQWGNENESLAIAAYESKTFSEVHSRNTFGRIKDRFIGGTCDGLVGTDGMIEVKCPNSDNHLLNMTEDAQVGNYIHQIQAYMWIYERDWCDFNSFDPRFPDDLQLYTKRINREDSVISQIDQRAKEMEDYISNLVEKAQPGFVFKPTEDA
jgi:hypothetical protein